MSDRVKLETTIKYYREAFIGVKHACIKFREADQNIIHILEDIKTEIIGIGKKRFAGEVLGTIISDGGTIVVLLLSFGCIITMPWATAAAAGIVVAVGQGTKIGFKWWEKHELNKREIPGIISDMLNSRLLLAKQLSAQEQNLLKMSKDLGESLDQFQTFVEDSSVLGNNCVGLTNGIFAPAASGLVNMARLGVGFTGATESCITGTGVAVGAENIVCGAGKAFTALSFAIIALDLYFLYKGKDESQVIDKIDRIIRDLEWEIDKISTHDRELTEKVNEDYRSVEKALERKLNELTAVNKSYEELRQAEERDKQKKSYHRELLAEFRRSHSNGSVEDFADFISNKM